MKTNPIKDVLFLPGRDRRAQARADELVLSVTKGELFDRHVLLPHAEVSDIVCAAVDRFLSKYSCSRLTLTIHTDSAVESVQDIFREAFRAHYDDECLQLERFLRRRMLRIAVLVLLSVAAYSSYMALRHILHRQPFVLVAISNLSAYCIWEICNTHFARRDAKDRLRRARCARDAAIAFVARPSGK